MYIGAWTEYRLAQEQLLNRRRSNSNDDVVPERQSYACSSGGTRRGIGIYHPSLPEKGGTEVSALPDRDSFRRSLESALSSNLAADDVEHISRVLEPLMQRLPAIGSVAHKRRQSVASGVSLNRRRSHHCVRRGRVHGGRVTIEKRLGATADQVRSDTGTRMIPEGTGSARSGFSAVSAPTGSTTGNTAFKAGLVPTRRESSGVKCGIAREDGWDAKRRTRAGSKHTPRIPHLPLLVDSRQAAPGTPTTLGPDSCSHIGARSKTVAAGAWETSTLHAPVHQVGSEACTRCCSHDIPSVGEVVALARFEDPKPKKGLEGGGGYDIGKATVILRAARRRDLSVLKADFQRFWMWKRSGAAARPPDDSPSSRDKRSTTSLAAIARSRAQDPNNAKQFDNGERKRADADRYSGARGPGNPTAIVAKVEALERMKGVYLSKGVSKGNSLKTGGGTKPAENPICSENKRIGTKMSGLSTGISSREPEPNVGGTVGSNSSDSRDRASASSEEGRALQSGDSEKMNVSNDDANERVVVVPDLELTESRIRLVEKYFGGGFRCSEEERQEGHPLATSGEGDAAGRRSAGNDRSKRASYDDEERCGGLEKTKTSETDDCKRLRCGTSVGSGGFIDRNGGGWDEAICEARKGESLDIASDGFTRHQGSAVPDPPRALPQQERELVRSTCHNPFGGRGSGVLREICKGDSVINSCAAGRQSGLERHRFGARVTTPRSPPPMEGASPCACLSTGAPLQAPSCSCNCSTSLEDLVCWTKGLDFEAAIEGF